MGIVGAIKDYCIANTDQEKAGIFLDDNGKAINDDYLYFQQQNWYRLQTNTLFDPNKFIFLHTHYRQTQQKLINHWKIVDTKKFKNNDKLVFNDEPLQSKWVYAIRRGVPLKFYKNIIQMMFSKNFNQQILNKKYQTLLYENIKKNANKMEVVTFVEKTQAVAFSNPFLNKQGTEATKKIAFLLKNTHSQLEHNPYIIKVIALMLIFVPEADTYDIMGTVIQGSTSMSIERVQSLRWHISLTNNQFQKFAREFYKTVKDISPSIKIINEHLNTEGIDKIQIFNEVIGDFFIGFVPFQIALRIFIIYLNQGVKIFYRFFYAILKMAGTSIRDSSNTKQILRAIRTKMLMNLTEQRHIRQFFRYAFDLQLQNLLKRQQLTNKKKQSQKFPDEVSIYFLPEITGDSQILSFQDLQIIWSFLPTPIKHYDIQKIFTTNQSNSNFKKFIQSLQEHNITLIIVQTIADAIFGIFIAEKLKVQADIEIQGMNIAKSMAPAQFSDTLTNADPKMKHSFSANALNIFHSMRHFGSSQNFLFILNPKVQKYAASGQNVYYCSYDDNSFTIGGPMNQPAFQLGASLTQGLSYSCPTYCNQPLHQGSPGQFKIKMIQCFSIQ